MFLDQTLIEIERGNNINKIGATGAYTKEFDKMQYLLNEIEEILKNKDKIDLDALENQMQSLDEKISNIRNDGLENLNDILRNATQDNFLNNVTLQRLQDDIKKLQMSINELNKNRTQILETNVEGALNLTIEAKDKADRALHKAQRSKVCCVEHF